MDDQLYKAPIEYVPEPPRAPTNKAKELIYKYQGSQKILITLGLAFFFTGLISSISFLHQLIPDLLLNISSTKSTATVKSIENDYSVLYDDEYPYEITFSYNVGNTSYTGSSSSFNSSLISDFIINKPVNIEYSNIVPSLARIQGMKISSIPLWILFILFFPITGLILTIVSIRSNEKEKNAYKYGIPAIAAIIHKGYDYSSTSNGKHPYQIIWKFKADEKFYVGSLSHMNPDELRNLINKKDTENENIVVVYLEDKPQINTLYI